jgi:hypothetical protein
LRRHRYIERDLGRESAAAELRNALDRRYEAGTADEGALRALIYARRPDGAADERGFRMLKIIRDTRKANRQVTLSQFRDMVKEQLAAGSPRRRARDQGAAKAPPPRRA